MAQRSAPGGAWADALKSAPASGFGAGVLHIESFHAAGRRRSAHGDGYPRFVEKEYRRYLTCGILARGFARLRCESCGHSRLVAFSCKAGSAPPASPAAVSDTAAQLTDHVFPEAPYRQWVLASTDAGHRGGSTRSSDEPW